MDNLVHPWAAVAEEDTLLAVLEDTLVEQGDIRPALVDIPAEPEDNRPERVQDNPYRAWEILQLAVGGSQAAVVESRHLLAWVDNRVVEVDNRLVLGDILAAVEEGILHLGWDTYFSLLPGPRFSVVFPLMAACKLAIDGSNEAN